MNKNLVGSVLLVSLLMAGAYLWVGNSGTFATEDDQAVLSVVMEGSRNAVAAIQSGKGQVIEHFWLRSRDDSILETETTYQVAFSGDRFKVSADQKYLKNIPGEPRPTDVRMLEPGTVLSRRTTYDGEKVVQFFPKQGRATITDPDSQNGRHAAQDYYHGATLVGRALKEIDKWPRVSPGDTRSPHRIIGREYLNGDECIVLEVTESGTLSDGGALVRTYWLWVSPAKGFTVLRIRGWVQGGASEEKRLSLEVDSEVRQYGGSGTWGPAKSTSRQYLLSRETGEYYKNLETTMTYDSGFEVNVPVSEEELILTLPSGTKVKDELLEETYAVP